jgi:outer membrane receptor protein involved in Fe transport
MLACPARAFDALEPVVVTATRLPVEEQRLAAMMTDISGADLRARGAGDLRSVMGLVSGVEAPAGGDAGPASAVPAFWGLHEFDAFVLAVDGVPLGGAFNPAIGALDLTNVDRVEVLKGAAPVTFGQTAMVGVIQVIHSPAGEAVPVLNLAAGAHGSVSGAVVINLPQRGDWKSSLSLSGEHQGFADGFARVRDLKGLYRLAGPLAGGEARLDLDFTLRRDRPHSPVVREGGGGLTDRTPKDANYNPADARMDEDRGHAAIGYDHPTPFGTWSSTASLALSQVTDVRGFLRPDLTDDGADNADAQHQHRQIVDGYLDTHLAFGGPFGAKLMVGADALYGLGRQTSFSSGYSVPLNGRVRAPSTSTLPVEEVNRLKTLRVFSGQYLQVDWTPTGPFSAFAGVRINQTSERRVSTQEDPVDPQDNLRDSRRRMASRITGNVGVSWRVWQVGPDHAVLFADYRNTGQPGSIDFGAEYRPEILKSERAQSYEAGLKGRLAGGRLSYEAAAFRLDDRNLEVSTTDANGRPILENAGGERLHGFEAEARYELAPGVELFASGSWHDAFFTRYIASEGGLNIDVGGKALTLSPQWLWAAGLVAAPKTGWGGSLVINSIGRRYLDLENKAPVPAYVTVDASVTWSWKGGRISLSGANLTDRRDPVTASEFGDQSYYRLTGRTIMLGVSLNL